MLRPMRHIVLRLAMICFSIAFAWHFGYPKGWDDAGDGSEIRYTHLRNSCKSVCDIRYIDKLAINRVLILVVYPQ